MLVILLLCFKTHFYIIKYSFSIYNTLMYIYIYLSKYISKYFIYLKIVFVSLMHPVAHVVSSNV